MGNMIDLIVITIVINLFFAVKYFREKYLSHKYKKHSYIQCENFIDFLHHDLKTPLLAQLRGLELLGNKNVQNLSKEEIIEQLKKSCIYVIDMIYMVENVYSFENNTVKPFYERFNMTELLIRCFETLSSDASEKNITFSYNLSTQDTYIEADKEEIKKVILNLLASAINYTDKGKEIRVTISDKKSDLQISMSGSNFARNIIDGSKYSTIGQSVAIYLCKKIIEIHKGKMFITEDEMQDKRIAFCIPKSRATIYN